jgi:hypothetical protein
MSPVTRNHKRYVDTDRVRADRILRWLWPGLLDCPHSRRCCEPSKRMRLSPVWSASKAQVVRRVRLVRAGHRWRAGLLDVRAH